MPGEQSSAALASQGRWQGLQRSLGPIIACVAAVLACCLYASPAFAAGPQLAAGATGAVGHVSAPSASVSVGAAKPASPAAAKQPAPAAPAHSAAPAQSPAANPKKDAASAHDRPVAPSQPIAPPPPAAAISTVTAPVSKINAVASSAASGALPAPTAPGFPASNSGVGVSLTAGVSGRASPAVAVQASAQVQQLAPAMPAKDVLASHVDVALNEAPQPLAARISAQASAATTPEEVDVRADAKTTGPDRVPTDAMTGGPANLHTDAQTTHQVVAASSPSDVALSVATNVSAQPPVADQAPSSLVFDPEATRPQDQARLPFTFLWPGGLTGANLSSMPAKGARLLRSAAAALEALPARLSSVFSMQEPAEPPTPREALGSTPSDSAASSPGGLAGGQSAFLATARAPSCSSWYCWFERALGLPLEIVLGKLAPPG